MVVVAEMEKHTVNVHEVHTVEVLVPKRNFGGSSNYGRKCNTPKYTLAVFDIFRVFCKPNLNVS